MRVAARPSPRNRGLSRPSIPTALALALALGVTSAPPAKAASLSFSGLLGGGRDWSEDAVHDVAIDRTGHLYVTGDTGAGNFPVSTGRTYGQPESRPLSFVAKLTPDGAQVVYATLLGGASSRSLALTDDGQVWIAGYASGSGFQTLDATQPTYGGGETDAFLARLDADGRLAFATWLGGQGRDLAWSIRILDGGDLVLAGSTSSPQFPTPNPVAGTGLAGPQDGFLARLSPDGRQVRWMTTPGGNDWDNLTAVAVGPGPVLLAAGQSNSDTLPGTRSTRLGPGGGSDAWVLGVDPATGVALWNTRVGGSSPESVAGLATAPDGSIGLLCQTASTDLPATPGTYRSSAFDDADAWLVRLAPDGSDLLGATHLPGRVGLRLAWPLEDYPHAKAGLAIDAQRRWITGLHGPSLVIGRLPESMQTWESVDLRGAGADSVEGLALAGEDNVLIGGGTGYRTRSPWFPTTPGSFQRAYRGSVSEAFVAQTSFATSAPTNDRIADAREVPPFDVAEWIDTTGAGADPGEPTHAGQPPTHSVWWQWTAPSDGRWIVDTAGSSFDTVVTVYRRNADGSLSAVAANDDQLRRRDRTSPDDTRSHVRVPARAGEAFLVAADGKAGASGALHISFQFSTASNDDPEEATTITGYGRFPGSNRGATLAPLEPSFAYGRHVVWWRWTATETGGVEFTATRDGTTAGVTLGVFAWPPNGILTDLEVGNGASAQIVAEAGQTRWLGIDSYWGETGDLEVQVHRTLPPPNDDAANAIRLEGAEGEALGSNINATPESAAWDTRRLPGSAGRTVWWTWTAPATGHLRLDTTGNRTATLLDLFQGDAPASLVWQAGCAANCRDLVPVEAGITYHLRLDTLAWDVPGELRFQWAWSQPPTWNRPERVVDAQGEWRLQATATGRPDRTYLLETSNDLITWTDSAGSIQQDGTTLTIALPMDPIASGRFCRLRERP